MATSLRSTAFLGTELKLNIHIDPIDDVTMDDYDFIVELYCSPKRTIIVNKADAIRAGEDDYIVCVDTNLTGAGDLKCKVTAQIPDPDFEDLLRTEIVAVDTGINIVKAL